MEVRANELRIGNLVHTKQPRFNDKIIEIESVNFESVNIDFRTYNIDELEPILITEERLKRAGFVRYPWGLVKNGILLRDSNLDCSSLILEIGNGKRIVIKYIHHLQNIWLDLTGEELTFI